MEELNALDLKKRPTIKQLYLDASGKEVKLDYFLFTSYEEDTTYHALPPQHRKQFDAGRWSVAVLASQGPEAAERPRSEELGKIFDELLGWYRRTYPVLAGTRTLDYEVHSELLGPYLRLVLDIRHIVETKTGKPLPAVGGEGLSPEGEALWSLIHEGLQTHFPSYVEPMFAYLEWSCRKAKPKDYDLGSLPPVGRYAAILQRFRRNSEPQSGVRRSSHPPRGGRPERSEGRYEGGAVRPGRPRERSHDRGPERPRSGRHGATRPPLIQTGQAKSPDRELEALAEVDVALRRLQSGEGERAVILKPQNSFIRRKQHKLIVEAGFASESVGEGGERAVKIVGRGDDQAGKKGG